MSLRDLESGRAQIVKILKCLSNERRLMIACALKKGEKNVTELERIVGLSQSALSQHLARLRRDNLVKTRRVAQTIYYAIGCEDFSKVMDSLSAIEWCKE